MLKMGDCVMFNIGKNSTVFEVMTDEFILDGVSVVKLKRYKGEVNTGMLVKMESLFEAGGFISESAMEVGLALQEMGEHAEPKERYQLDSEDRLILQEINSHIRAGIQKLKERNVRGVNIEIELTQFIRNQLREH